MCSANRAWSVSTVAPAYRDTSCTRSRSANAVRSASASGAAISPLEPGSGGPSLRRDVIDQHVIAQPVGTDEERPAAVQPCHLVHELHQVMVRLEHERVDHDVLARAAADFEQSLVERLRKR